MRKLFLSFFFSIASIVLAFSQPVIDDLPQITNSLAFINAKVIASAGKPPVKATIIVRDGLITEISPQAKIPADAYRIQADSLYAYPAFIDAYSGTGLKDQEENNQSGPGQNRNTRPPVDEEGFSSLEDAGITPFNEVRGVMDPKNKSIADWRAQGFAIAHVMPKGKMIPGKGALIVLSGKDVDQLIWKENTAMFSQLVSAGNTYPGTIIGVMAKWRELYHNSSQYVKHQSTYEQATLVSRPQYNRAHEALAPVVKGELPLFFRAPGVKDISRALELKNDLGMKMVIVDAEEAYFLKDRIKNASVPVVLSLDLPSDKSAEPKKEEKTDDSPEKKDTTVQVPADPEKVAFEKKRAESLKAHRSQAATLASSNIPFSFGTQSIKATDFSKNIQLIIENGLNADKALHALTIEPAKLLGIEKYAGTLETGKMANIILTNKPLFGKETSIKYMVVEGALYEYDVKEKKKKTDGASPNTDIVTGIWNWEMETAGVRRDGTIEIKNENGELTGTIKSKDITSGDSELDNIVLDNENLSFTFDFTLEGRPVTLEFDLVVKDETFEGSVNMGEFGNFIINGQRISKPQ